MNRLLTSATTASIVRKYSIRSEMDVIPLVAEIIETQDNKTASRVRADTLKEVGEEVRVTVEQSADYREMESNLKIMADAWLKGISPTEALKQGEMPK